MSANCDSSSSLQIIRSSNIVVKPKPPPVIELAQQGDKSNLVKPISAAKAKQTKQINKALNLKRIKKTNGTQTKTKSTGPISVPRNIFTELENFVPVTRDNVKIPIKMVQKHGDRIIASVFDPMFLMPRLTDEMIVQKYQPIFGTIQSFNILVRITSPDRKSVV